MLPRRLAVNAGIGGAAMNAGTPAANSKADEKSAASKRRELEQWQQSTGLSMMEVKLIASRFKVRLFGCAAPCGRQGNSVQGRLAADPLTRRPAD